MIDDFLILSHDQVTCQRHLNALISICADIGIPFAPDKTTSPSMNTVFLGIELDTQTQCAKLPMDKLNEYSSLIDHHLSKSKITQHDLESLVGKLSFAASVVPARPFLRRLIDLINPHHKPYYYTSLSKETKEDLLTWKQFLSDYNGITYFRSLHTLTSDSISMSSDASHMGFGGCYGTKWIQCQYPPFCSSFNITVLEIYPIYVLISMFGQNIPNSNILFYTDNSAVKDIINKQTSKDKRVMSIVRPLILTLVHFNINLKSSHIPGHTNILPDQISRFKVNRQLLEEHRMDPSPTLIPEHLRPENFFRKFIKMS